jgi:hypothetical protein
MGIVGLLIIDQHLVTARLHSNKLAEKRKDTATIVEGKRAGLTVLQADVRRDGPIGDLALHKSLDNDGGTRRYCPRFHWFHSFLPDEMYRKEAKRKVVNSLSRLHESGFISYAYPGLLG